MRGVSALANVLRDRPEASLAVFVIWEPVLRTDGGPPAREVADASRDPRVRRYWDPDYLVSAHFTAAFDGSEAARWAQHPPLTIRLAGKTIVWDSVFVFPPGATWGEYMPFPRYHGGPVVHVQAALGHALDTVSP